MNKNRHSVARTLAVGLLTAASLVAMTACAGASPAPAASKAASADTIPKTMTTVNVGITGATAPPTFLPLIAQKFGLDTKNNLKISFVTLAPNVTAQALSQGSVSILAAPSVETATLQGAPFKIIAGAAASYWHFVASKDVANWKALAGKKIALPCGVGATCDSFVQDVLTSHGVDPSSVTFINGTAQGTYDSLAAGSVDAALTTAPYTYALSSAGKTKEFDISKEKPYLSTQFTATTNYINTNPAVISAFVKTMVEAEKEISALPVSAKVLTAIDAFEQANGINPATLDQKRFLTEFSTDKSWQLVPTKALIDQDLTLLKAIPTMKAMAQSATFTQLVYQVPEFTGQYE
jgi:ABC-type nitrate/sulfonate/bicarbonate transport system substrate-binding protein